MAREDRRKLAFAILYTLVPVMRRDPANWVNAAYRALHEINYTMAETEIMVREWKKSWR